MKRYLLVGPSGVGKACFANNLVGQNLFRIDHYNSVRRLESQTGELPQGRVQLHIMRGWTDEEPDSESWLLSSIQKVFQVGLDAILYFVPINIARIDLRPGGGTGPTCYRRILNCLRDSCDGDSNPPVWIVFTMCARVQDEDSYWNRTKKISVYTNWVDFWLSHKRDGIQLHSRRLSLERVILADNMSENWCDTCEPLWKAFDERTIELGHASPQSVIETSYRSVGYLLPEHPAKLVYWNLENSSQQRGVEQ